MPDDEDIALSEKRMYGQRRAATRAYVASGMGVAYVAVSDDQIGRFGLERECRARAIAGADGRLAVATDEDVLVGASEGLEPTGFGPAVAVGADPVLAADDEGRVARLEGDEWTSVGAVDGEVRAIEGPLVAVGDPGGAQADGGVYRVSDDGLDHVGLTDARDVAAAGPLAATSDGLHRLGNGWRRAVEGEATVAASDGERAHAVVDGALLDRAGGGWVAADPPREGVVDVAYGDPAVAVTGDGTVLIDPVAAKDGAPAWRERTLGVRDVVGVAVP